MDLYCFDNGRLSFRHGVTENPPCDFFSSHIHNSFELIYFISGDATHIIEDRKYKLKGGDLILIRPARYHYIQIDSPAVYERYDILFSGRDIGSEELIGALERYEVLNISRNKIATDIMKKMDYYCERLTETDFSQVLPLLLKELFYNLRIEKNRERTEYSVLSPLISDALKYINGNLFTVKSVGEIAESLFITESYLYRLFKTELKVSPKKYINEKRLLCAKNLIASGKKPTEIYSSIGFGDYTSFYRNYVAYFGNSPSQDG